MEKKESKDLIWKSESEPESMVSATIGRVMSALLGARLRKLQNSISHFSPDSTKRPSLGSLEDSLWFLYNYVKDTAERGEKLDEILIPIIENSLRNKDSRHGGNSPILMNWLFQDECLFQSVASNFANIILRKDDRHISFGWCILTRNLVEYESFMNQSPLNGITDNYYSLLKILCSCVQRLSCIMCKGSTLQDGFELPSRLSVSAADCFLSLSEALTKNTKVLNNKPEALKSSVSDRPVPLVPVAVEEKKVQCESKSLEVSNIEMSYLLWNQIDELTILLQKLHAWSRKSRPLHAKGVEQVLKWLQEMKGHYAHIQDEAGVHILKTRAFLLSSCWKHYSILLHLEDHRFSQHCNELLDQYISGIQYFTDNHAEGHIENKDTGLETRKFFLNCLCLLLGRFDRNKFESTFSQYGMQLSQILLSQLLCADEDVIAVAICVFKSAIFTPNYSPGSSLTDNRQMDTVLPLLLNLLDERDGIARAVVMLIAEYCSMSTDGNCLKEVLKRLASGNSLQRKNAIDVISELVHLSYDSTKTLSHLAWQDTANKLLVCLNDEEPVIREQASNLLSMIDPSLVLPALVQLVYSSDEGVQSSGSATLISMLKRHHQKPEIICMLLDCLSNLSQRLDHSKTTGVVKEGSRLDTDRVLKLILEWSKSVQDWNSLIVPLIDKMFAEPANATIVRFLSYISEHLAEAADIVLYHILLQLKGQEEGGSRSYMSQDLVKMQQSLFERLCPLLILRLLPLRVFNDPNSAIVYGQLPNKGIIHEAILESGDINIVDHESIAASLLKRAFNGTEFEDVRKLAAELCGRLHPQVLFPIVSFILEDAASSHDILKIKACLFSVCTSLVVRGNSVSDSDILEIRKTIESVLLWPSIDGDEVSKAQHGCIDCLALMICAELQTPASMKNSQKLCIVGKSDDSGNVASTGNSTLNYVIHRLINDKNEVVPASKLSSEECALEGPVHHSFRLCMANVLISACQKISDSGRKSFAKRTLPYLICSVEVIMYPQIRAACVQVLFSAVYHLKAAVLAYSSDLVELSLKFIRKESDKERMAGAKLLASLMASEDAVLESISKGLLEARPLLSSISLSDPSNDLRQMCQKLLACITSPQVPEKYLS